MTNRSRAAAIIIEQGSIAIIKRTFPERIHYAYPGGSVEPGEEISAAVQREMLEELGVQVIVDKLVATIAFGEQMQYFFLASIVGGSFGSGDGEEFHGARAGTFQPEWALLEELRSLPILPALLTEYVIESSRCGWKDCRHFVDR